jgi:hypothetical protein
VFNEAENEDQDVLQPPDSSSIFEIEEELKD